jgi:hypothetical protein
MVKKLIQNNQNYLPAKLVCATLPKVLLIFFLLKSYQQKSEPSRQ